MLINDHDYSIENLLTTPWSINSLIQINESGMILASAQKAGATEASIVLLLPVALQSRDPETGVVSVKEDPVAPADQRPEIEMHVTNARLNTSGDLEVTVQGTVKDRLSEVFEDATKRVPHMRFSVNGTVVGAPFNLQYGAGTPPFTVANSENSFLILTPS